MSNDGQAYTSAAGGIDGATRAAIPSPHAVTVTLIRHGEVEAFGDRVVRGQLDVPVSARGRAQHTAVARWFAATQPRPAAIVSSDLSRCAVLAGELGVATGTAVRLDPQLREQSMGDWEGKTWADLQQIDSAAVSAYWGDYVGQRPTGGESIGDLHARIGRWWERFVRGLAPGSSVAVVTHIGVIRVLTCRLLGIPVTSALRTAPAAASVTTFLIAEAGAVLNAFGERPWLV
jgi:broad specificity phosphatase PhoE